VLSEAGDEVDPVYFPHFGMLSLLAVLGDGKAIETATVGREGVVGATAAFTNRCCASSCKFRWPVAGSRLRRAVVTEARFCRWLLQRADRSARDTVAPTQEFLAEMLGVRRTSVTAPA
jgi:hypothetical protein